MGRSLLPLVGLVAVATAGCSYDWATGGSATRDAGFDASAQQDAPGDGAVVTEAASDGLPSGPDVVVQDVASTADGPNCQALTATLQAAKQAAVACTQMPLECMTKVTDECGCSVVIGEDPSTAKANFESAIAAFVAAHCDSTALCPVSCPTVTTGICLYTDAGGASACYQ